MPSPEAKLPIDPNVPVPPGVARAAAAAAAAHAAAYGQPAPAVTDPPAPPAPAATDPPAPPAPAATDPPAPVLPPVAPPAPADDPNVNWEHRYHSMKGRFDQSQQTIGQLQQQMSELGDELMRSQQSIAQLRSGTAAPPQTRQPAQRHITDADVQTYGSELIDVVQRAARDAVAPDLQQVTQQTRQVNQRVMQTAQGQMFADLDRDVPTWREINVNPRFKSWCRSPDVYSGVVRGKLLQDAFQAADAPRVVSFFAGFLREEVATGQVPAPGAQPPAAASAPAPRIAAVPLENLTAPGRAKPAGGEQPANAADKPVITRAQVAAFYSKVRAGGYAGNEKEKAQHEAMIFSAQADGRIR